MKKLFLYIAIIASVLYGCTSKIEEPDSIEISQTICSVTSNQQNISITVTSTKDWTLAGTSDWCTPSKAAGSNGEAITFAIDQNTGYESRSSSFTFICGNEQAQLEITQEQSNVIALSKNEFKVTSEGADIEISVDSNVEYTYTIADDCIDWISYTKTKALTTSVLVFNIKENTKTSERNGTITLNYEDITETIQINQDGALPILEVDNNSFEIGQSSKEITVNVTSNIDYTIEVSDNEWITSVGDNQDNTNRLKFLIAENNTFENRTGTVTLHNEIFEKHVVISIQQSYDDVIIIEEDTYEISGDACVLKVKVMTTVPHYNINIPENDWFSLIQTKSLNTEYIEFNIQSNDKHGSRSISVVISDDSNTISKTIYITQSSLLHGIYNYEDLLSFAEEISKPISERNTEILSYYGEYNATDNAWSFWLEDDIEMQSSNWPGIGSEEIPFDSAFDGKDFNINNLVIEAEQNYNGLFNYVGSKGTIKNLTIESGSILSSTANIVIGVIAGCNYGSIESCTNYANVNSNTQNSLGGITGDNYGEIKKCLNYGEIYVNGDITYTSYGIAGIVGQTHGGLIYDCHNKGKVHTYFEKNNGNKVWAGGICGRGSGGNIEFCSNSAEINIAESDNNAAQAGGIVGWNSTCHVYGCYNTGSIKSSYTSHRYNYYASSGGIVGSGGHVVACYNTGDIYSNGGYAGGINGECGNDFGAYGCYNTSEQLEGYKTDGICARKYNISKYINCKSLLSTENLTDSINTLNDGITEYNNKNTNNECRYEFYLDGTSVYPQIRSTK